MADVHESEPHDREGIGRLTETLVGAHTPAGTENDTQEDDVEKRQSLKEAADGDVQENAQSRHTSSTSSPCLSANDAEQNEGYTVVSFKSGDPGNPYNWNQKKKTYVLLTCMALVMNSTIGSALPSGASQETAEYFNITGNQSLLVLPVSIFLVGYVLGPLVFAPMSESFGRKWVVMATFITFTAFNLGCALAPTFAGLIVMRLVVGISASTPISVIGGIYADIYGTAKARGRAMTVFMAATTWGPLIGPIISGFVATVSWRWTYWVALIIAGATWPFLIFLPETYGPLLLRRRAEKLRKQTGNEKIVAPVEIEEKQSWGEFCTVVLTRPVRMFLFEWIVLFSCLYLSVAYAIFYIFFQAYPIIYQGTYGFSAGEEGLTFLPIGVGAVFAGGIYLYWERYLERARSRPTPPAWSRKEEFVRLPIACLGAPLFAISLFWLGWTAKPEIHWIVPTLSALPFGTGFLLICKCIGGHMALDCDSDNC